MTQADFAIKINVTDKAVSRWERGIGFPDINTIEPLASALEIRVLEIMKKITLIASVIFIILTFVGAGYILLNGGKVNAGYACVPMIFALVSMFFYRKYK